MNPLRRLVAVLLVLTFLQNLGIGLVARPALAAGYTDPLGVLPDWAALLDGDLDPTAPPDPLAGLLPRNPLAGLLPNLPSPPSPAAPATGGTGATSTPEAQAPGHVSLPTPPPAPATPGEVSLVDGSLSLTEQEMALPRAGGLSLGVTRLYRSSEAASQGAFGHGWDLALNQRLQMYVDYHITEHRGDGGKSTFQFQDGTNSAFVESFDGDSLIHIDLSKGQYTSSGASGWSLVRAAQDRYVVTRPDGSTYTYQGYYAPWRTNQDARAGRLLSAQDRFGNRLDFTYNAQGELTRVADTNGRFLSLTWSDGVITTVRDHTGRLLTYTYTGGRLTQVSSPDHPTLTYGYDANHRLISLGGGPAGSVTFAYDSEGRVTRAGQETYSYTAIETVRIDAAGGVWRYTLDDQKRITRTVDPLGRATSTTFDSEGRTESVTAPDETRTYTYDDQGRILTETRSGRTTRYTHGAFGLVTAIATPVGTTQFRYDEQGSLVGRTNPGHPEVTFTYDQGGRMLSETDGAGQTTRYEYADSPHGFPDRIIDPLGRGEQRTSDALGQLTSITDARGFTTAYTYDKAGRVIRSANPAGGITTYTYDGAGRLVAADAPGGAGLTY